MNIASLKTAPAVPVPFEARRLFGNGAVEMIHIRLEPGQLVPPHDNPDDVLFYVLEGTGDLTMEEQSRQLDADHLVAIPTGVRRGWANNSKQPLRLLVVKLLNGVDHGAPG
jgi:quercetin dioxygenase-like cupin family protein